MFKRNRSMDTSDTPISRTERNAMQQMPAATEEEKARERQRQARVGRMLRDSQAAREAEGRLQ